MSEPTFDAWKKKYAGMGVDELRRVKQLEEENRRLNRVVADLPLDKAMLRSARRREIARFPVEACRVPTWDV